MRIEALVFRYLSSSVTTGSIGCSGDYFDLANVVN